MSFLWWLSDLRTPVLTDIMGIITKGGEEVFLMAIMCLFYWCIDKRFAYRIAFPYFFAGTTVQGLKVICRVPRPWIKDPGFIPEAGALETATGYSFPSGHTFSATVLFTSFALKTRKYGWKILWFVCTGLVMLSRMYLGCHTPQDVLVSFTICLIITLVCSRIFDRLEAGDEAGADGAKKGLSDKKRKLIFVGIFAYTGLTLVYSSILYMVDYVTLDNTQDVFKTCGAGIAFAICWYMEGKYIKFKPRACSLGLQIVKVIIGLAGVLAFKSGLKLIIGDSLVANLIRYFLIVAWAMGLYPAIIHRFFEKEN